MSDYNEQSKGIAEDGGEILQFEIDNAVYGIEIQYITEIIQIQQITIVPKVPDYIKGMMNLRGKVIPVMSVRGRFGKEEIPYDDRTCIIVVEWDGLAVGLIVDRVREVARVLPEEISSTPDYKNVNMNHFIKYIIESNGEIKLLLDCETLVMER
ncbi:MAG: chemotaxis protein CheW [Oscillospiraceae bacterium]